MGFPIEENNEQISFYTKFGAIKKDNKTFTRLEFNNPFNHKELFFIDLDRASTDILNDLEDIMRQSIIKVYPHFPTDVMFIMVTAMFFSMEKAIKEYEN